MATAIAVRYARALADLVVAPTSAVDPRSAVLQLRAFENLLSSSEPMRHILYSPAVPAPRKRAVIATFAGRLELHLLVRNVLWILSDHRRIASLADVCDAFEAVVDERLGMVKAEVASAAPLDTALRDQLSGVLAGATGKKVRCEYSQQPDLLGGIRVKIGSTIFDGSVRARLENLRRRMMSEV